MLVIDLELEISFLGSILITPILDKDVESFIKQMIEAGKRLVYLVEGYSPGLFMHIKGKDKQFIQDELNQLTHYPPNYNINVEMDS